MRKALYASAIALFGLTAVSAQAMMVAPLPSLDPGITLVAGGCGAGFHRGPYGGCVRNGGVAVVGAPVAARPVVVGAPRYHYYGGRRCVWRGGVRVCG
jgi:hypothetical protein